MLAKGTTVEMVLDRQLIYDEAELNFSDLPPRYSSSEAAVLCPAARRKAPAPFPVSPSTYSTK